MDGAELLCARQNLGAIHAAAGSSYTSAMLMASLATCGEACQGLNPGAIPPTRTASISRHVGNVRNEQNARAERRKRTGQKRPERFVGAGRSSPIITVSKTQAGIPYRFGSMTHLSRSRSSR